MESFILKIIKNFSVQIILWKGKKAISLHIFIGYSTEF